MKSFTISGEDDGKRLDRYAANALAGVGASMVQKYIRLKKIKVNGKPGKPDDRLKTGDVVEMYVSDDVFETSLRKPDRLYENFKPHIDVVYEDEDLLIVDKKPGLISHPDENERVNTLVTHVRAYLYKKGEWSAQKGDFAPVLLNRLDRFTGGLVMAAKTKQALDRVNRAIRNSEITKRYICICHGRPRPAAGTFRNYLTHTGRHVFVSPISTPGGKLSITHYRTLDTKNGLSLVECELVTGRTHQIRAQMAYANYPILGDNSYGKKDDDKRFGRSYQALYAVQLAFGKGIFERLDGMVVSVDAPFVREYFPDYKPDLRTNG
ncbi:MAG: RluA family pseudouridine synthase [Clostridia bacterium]|nr:RluA family pseudouridine synthase [Clostridia bacterium]